MHRSPHGQKSIHALCCHMIPLDYLTEPAVNYLDSDVNDAAFVRATHIIGGRDAVKKF
jgi:hypothetical protein